MNFFFKNFTVNTKTRELIYKDQKLFIQNKVFDLLVFLIENSDKIVSKERIQSAVWKNVIVSETALTRAIMKLRKVLSIDSNTTFIETIHGKGYRFLVQVEASKDLIEKKTKSLPSKIEKYIFLLIVSLLLLFSLYFVFQHDKLVDGESRIAILPIINETGDNELSWVSIGLIGLVSELIKAQSEIHALPLNDFSLDMNEIKDSEKLILSENVLTKLKLKSGASHIIIARLRQKGDFYVLQYVFYHPKGYLDIKTLSDKNPTILAQMLASEIIGEFPKSTLNFKTYRQVSQEPFINELYSRGMSLLHEGKFSQAREHFKLVILDNPDVFWPKVQHAITTRELGFFDDSILELEKLIEELKINNIVDQELLAQIYNSLGGAYCKKYAIAKCKEFYLKAYEAVEETNEYDLSSKIASNLAFVYKGLKKYIDTQSWITKSIRIRREFNLPKLSGNIRLLGELEYIRGNYGSSRSYYEEAFQIDLENNNKHGAIRTLNILSEISRINGFYEQSHTYVEKSFELLKEVNNEYYFLKTNVVLEHLLIEEGKIQQAIDLNNITRLKLKKHDKYLYIESYMNYITSLFLQKKYEEALGEHKKLIEEFPEIMDPSNEIYIMGLILEYSLGINKNIEQWLLDNRSLSNDPKFNLLYNRVNIYFLESNHKYNELIAAYRNDIEKTKSKFFHADTVKRLLKLANLYIKRNNFKQAIDISNEIRLYGLNWWQIKVLDSQIEFFNGNIHSARTLILEAKESTTTEQWTEDYELIFKKINFRVEN